MWANFEIFEKLSKVNTLPMGKNLNNLVILGTFYFSTIFCQKMVWATLWADELTLGDFFYNIIWSPCSQNEQTAKQRL
jgi:hypothetical protein